MIPGSAQFAGMSEAQRNAIVQALLAQQGAPAAAAPAPFLNPYQDIVDPSDPAVDSNLGEVVGNIQSPAISNPNTALGFLLGDFDAAINAPTPSNVIDSITVSPPSVTQPDPAQPAQIDDQGNVAPIDFSALSITPDPPSTVIAEPGLVQQGLLENGALLSDNESGFAINAGLEDVGALSTSVNDAVDAAMGAPQGFGGFVNAGYTSDPGGFGDAVGGFGTGTGFSSADAANDAVSGALGAAIDAASGYDSSGNVDGGPGGGGGGGGDGGK